MDLVIIPLSPGLLKDFLDFFDQMTFTENPDWEMCYCYSFHFTGIKEQWNKVNNRSAVIQLINEKKMRGYLAFLNGRPVGWCNVNERQNYQRLLKYYDLDVNPEEKICSVVCYLVYPQYRRKGIAQKMLERICRDYASDGYDAVEAYPAKGKLSCERYYMGPLGLYSKNGFSVVKECENHFIVRKNLS